MLYEQYRARMNRFADILGVARRFRVLIITLCLTIVTLTAGFFGLCGLVYDTGNCPESIIVGEELRYGTNAIFNSVRYEFSVAGTDVWTAQQPTRPGEYLVRTYSKSVFGNNRYGAAHAFAIMPKTVDVRVEEGVITYGELPAVTADLCYDDTIKCSKFIYENLAKPTTLVKADADGITVTDKDGNDVTNSYIYRIFGGQISFEKRAITVTFEDYKGDYNGEVLNYKTYAVNEDTPIADGDILAVADLSFGPDAGVSELAPEVKIFNEEAGIDVSSNYDINIVFNTSGTVTIDKRPIYITTVGAEKVYDGKPLSHNEYSIEEECKTFLESLGHKLEVVGTTAVTKVTGEEGVDNIVLKFIITDADGGDVTDNYVLLNRDGYGKLKVKPRPVTILSADDATQVFDGKPHTSKQFFTLVYENNYDIADGDTVVITSSTEGIFAGDYENVITAKIMNADGEDVTHCYDISYSYGTLTILPRPITVITESETFIYDGNAHSTDKFTVPEDALVLNHHVEASGFATVTDVGTVDNTMHFGVYDEEGNIVTSNYKVHITAGKLTILPRPVILAPENAEKVYDGTPLENDVLISLSEYPIVEGQTATAETTGSQLNVDLSANAIADINTLKITAADGKDVTANYTVSGLEYGSLEVTVRNVSIVSGSAEKVYDETPLFCEEYDVVSELGFVESQTVEILSRTEITYVKVDESGRVVGVPNELVIRVTDAGNPVTENYNITAEYGELKILKCGITLITADGEWVYDGDKHEYAACDVDAEWMTEDKYALYRSWNTEVATIIDVGEEDNVITNIVIKRIVGGSEIDVTDSFEINYVWGKLRVTRREVTVLTGTAEKVYDDSLLFCEEYEVVSELDFVDGQTVTVTKRTEITYVRLDADGNVISAPNELEVTVSNGIKDVTSNYDISYVYGDLTVKKRPVTITTSDAAWVYNADIHTCAEHEVINLVKGHVTSAHGLAGVKNVADSGTANTMQINVYDVEGKEVTPNYDMTYEYGTLNIIPRPLQVKANNKQKEYDGIALLPDKAGIDVLDGNNENEGLVSGHRLFSPELVGNQTNAGSSDITFTGVSIGYVDGFEIIDVTDNYEITYINGTLTVTPREIEITAGSDDKIYDGTPLTCHTYAVKKKRTGAGIVSAALVLDHETDGEKLTYPSSRTDAGNEPNMVEYNGEEFFIYSYLGENGEQLAEKRDVTRNYNITLTAGTLTVNKREVKVTSPALKQWIYDATVHYWLEYEVSDPDEMSGIVEGHTHKADETEGTYATIKDVVWRVSSGGNKTVGAIKNFFSVLIFDGEREVTDNYEISYKFGNLRILNRPLMIETEGKEFEYNGLPQYHKEFSVYKHFNPIVSLVNNEELGIVHTIEADPDSWSSVTNVSDGEILNWCSKFYIYEAINGEGKTDVTDNYRILSNTKGKLKVTPREITVVADDGEKIYNGEEQYGEKFKTAAGTNPVADGQIIVATTNEYGITVGDYDVTVKDGSASVRSYKDGEEVDESENYTILYDSTVKAKLTIIKRTVTFNTATQSWVYNDEVHSDGGHSVRQGSLELVLNHTSKSDGLTEIKDVYFVDGVVSGIDNEMTITIWDGETEVTENYDIKYHYGTLKVTPRPITVTACDRDKVYDGTPLVYNKCDYTSTDNGVPFAGLLENKGHTITAYAEGSQTDVGESKNKVKDGVRIFDKDGADVTANYAITTAEGTLKVTARPIKITTGSGNWTYDGNAHFNLAYIVAAAEENSGLLDGHTHAADTTEGSYTVVTDVGEWSEITLDDGTLALKVESFKNRINVLFFDKDGVPVTNNYSVEFEYGELVILPRPLNVITESNSWIYDGKLHSEGKAIYSGLVENHTPEITEVTFVLDVGEYENALKIAVWDGERDVTNNYRPVYENGTLTITPRPIGIVTEGREKEYDGKPLVHKVYAFEEQAESSGLVAGQKITAEDWAEIIEVGEIDNTATIIICATVGGEVKDVTANYEIIADWGILKVIAPEGDGGTGGDLGDGEGSGNNNGGAPSLAVSVLSDADGSIYLRYRSYGNYFDGHNFVSGTEFECTIDGKYSANYLASLALKLAGAPSAKVEIQVYGSEYYLPYYMGTDGDYDAQASDVVYTGDVSDVYSLVYYLCDTVTPGNLGEYADFERMYREYVHNNYLYIDAATKEFMQGIIAEQKFDPSNPAVIANVAGYIQTAARYNLDYDAALDAEDNVVISFLRDYKEGVCRHYSKAATLLYRALGIPARYVIGYVGTTKANEWVEITTDNAHAWVEVYIDGFGWLQVEVTGSGFNDGSGGGNGSGDGSGMGDDYADMSLVLKPADMFKFYDGEPLKPTHIDENLYLNELIEIGYTYKVTFYGEQTDIGVGKSKIKSFTLYDPAGNNATSYFNFEYADGELTVLSRTDYDETIYVHYNSQVTYDGTAHYFSEDGFYCSNELDGFTLPAGYTVQFSVNSHAGIKDAVNISGGQFADMNILSVRVLYNGMDVTDRCFIVYDIHFEISRRVITLTTNSVTREYIEGEPLYDSTCYISGAGLASGHEYAVVDYAAIEDVGEIENEVKIAISDGVEQVTGNYRINRNYGKLTIINQ